MNGQGSRIAPIYHIKRHTSLSHISWVAVRTARKVREKEQQHISRSYSLFFFGSRASVFFCVCILDTSMLDETLLNKTVMSQQDIL